MTNRRKFIQHGVALSAAPLVLGPALAAAAEGSHATERQRMKPVLAVFDHRYPESRLFASSLEEQGIPTRAIAGDITSLWYDDLYHRWAAGPSPIVGLTGASSLFCLEHLAWKVERRVVFRIEHRQIADTRVEHQITGPAPVAVLSAGLAANDNWPLLSAAAVRVLPAMPRRGIRFTAHAAGPTIADITSWEEPLVTWVIAPKPQSPIGG